VQTHNWTTRKTRTQLKTGVISGATADKVVHDPLVVSDVLLWLQTW